MPVLQPNTSLNLINRCLDSDLKAIEIRNAFHCSVDCRLINIANMSSQKKDMVAMDSLKDVKSIDEIDFEKIELQRGKTPDAIKEKCLKLCKEYLSGNWLSQTVDSIEVRRVSGGLTNQLYFCGITKPSQTSDVPQEVAVRLYGAKHLNVGDENNERLTDVVIALMVSESGLGPKVYGIFEEGQIHHFYKHRQFKVEEQKDPVLVKEVFQKLARVHAMDVPIKKSHWLFTEFDKFYDCADKCMNNGMRDALKEANSQLVLGSDLKAELNWLKEMIVKSNSPMVFTHNDFRSSNIMVLEDRENNNVNPDERLVLCDFEYSSYGYRGHDFGFIINEWGRGWNDMFRSHTFPDDSTLRHLVGIYIEESERLFGDKYTQSAVNSMDPIIQEIKLFTMSCNLFFTLWCLGDKMDDTMQMDKKITAQFAESCFKEYQYLKDKFTKENALF